MSESDIHAELADIVAGRVAAQPGADHRYVFDSTGLAVQDLAAAEMVLERARAMRGVPSMTFNDFSGARDVQVS
jgi:alanine dehydrogenase